MDGITIDNFAKLYNDAKENHLMSFVFNEIEFSLGYASYLLNFVFPKKYNYENDTKRQENTC